MVAIFLACRFISFNITVYNQRKFIFKYLYLEPLNLNASNIFKIHILLIQFQMAPVLSYLSSLAFYRGTFVERIQQN